MVKKKTLINKINELKKEEEALVILLDHYLTIIEESTKDKAFQRRIKIPLQHIKEETEQHVQALSSLVLSVKRRKKDDY